MKPIYSVTIKRSDFGEVVTSTLYEDNTLTEYPGEPMPPQAEFIKLHKPDVISWYSSMHRARFELYV